MENKNALWAALTIIWGGCATMKNQTHAQTVMTQGEARVNPQDRPSCRAKALARAEKAAIEKALGLRISEATELSASVVTHEAIEAESFGVINHYDILKEGENGGIYQVAIKAVVSPLPPSEQPQLSLFSKAPPNSQSLTLIEGGKLKKSLWSKLALARVEEGFKSRGFSFNLSQNKSGRFIVHVRGLSFKFLNSPLLGNLKSCRTKIDIQIKDTLKHRLVVDHWVEAAGVGGSKNLAFERALSQASQKAGTKSAEELAKNLWAQL